MGRDEESWGLLEELMVSLIGEIREAVLECAKPRRVNSDVLLRFLLL